MVVTMAVGNERLALWHHDVVALHRLIHVTPVPGAPVVVEGVINVHGEILPVIDMRRRLGVPPRPPRLDDVIVIVETTRRLALHVDGAVDVATIDHTAARRIDLPDPDRPGRTEVVAEVADGLVLIHDIDSFLFPDEVTELDAALEAAPHLDPAGADWSSTGDDAVLNVLRLRAAALATSVDDPADTELCGIVRMRAGGTWFALPATAVREVLSPGSLSVVGGADHPVVGVRAARGAPIAVVDVAQLAGSRTTADHHGCCVVVLDAADDLVGLLAERVDVLAETPIPDDVASPGIIRGVAGGAHHVDPHALLADRRFAVRGSVLDEMVAAGSGGPGSP